MNVFILMFEKEFKEDGSKVLEVFDTMDALVSFVETCYPDFVCLHQGKNMRWVCGEDQLYFLEKELLTKGDAKK